MSLKVKTAPKPKTASKSKTSSKKTTAETFAVIVARLEATATNNAVKVTPGHGVAGRHATRALLDALSGNKDPGMFGRMFPTLPPLNGE